MFRREHHQRIGVVLEHLNPEVLQDCWPIQTADDDSVFSCDVLVLAIESPQAMV